MQKPLPIGISDFEILIEGGYAYVDKTLLIQELVEKGAYVALILRSGCFGKTLNLSMLRYFFEKVSRPNSMIFEQTAPYPMAKVQSDT